MDTIPFPKPSRRSSVPPASPAPARQSARFQAEEIDRIEAALRRSVEAICPRCESPLVVEGPFVVRDTSDRVMVARCGTCGRSMTARARPSKPPAPAFDNLVVSNPRDRRLGKSLPGSLLSLTIHGLVIYGAILGTMRVTSDAPEALADTTMVFLTADQEPEEVPEEREPPKVTMAVTAPPKGFQTLDVPLDIPTEIPPVDLGERFDPRDFSGRGVEGGVFAGSQGGTGEVSERHVFDMSAVDEPPEFLSGSPAKYPEALRQAGMTGYVTVEFVVDTTGLVDPESIRVLETTRREFVEPAVEAVRNSRYRPARVRGIPVRVLVSQRIDFHLVRR